MRILPTLAPVIGLTILSALLMDPACGATSETSGKISPQVCEAGERVYFSKVPEAPTHISRAEYSAQTMGGRTSCHSRNGLVSELSSPVHARTFELIFAFGDSYSDTGAGYVDGNGPTAVAYLAEDLGVPFTHVGDSNSAGKGLNFAVSGASTGSGNGLLMRPAGAACGVNEGLLGRGMMTQVLEFVQRVNSGEIHFNPAKTLFFLAGGINDGGVNTKTVVANLEGEIRKLYETGGRYFLVAQIPTKIPGIARVGKRLNPAISRIPSDLGSSLPGAHIKISSWGAYFDAVLEHPTSYGIMNTIDRCAGRALFGEDPTPCAAPGSYFYFHEGHPSTAVQRIVGTELKREVMELASR